MEKKKRNSRSDLKLNQFLALWYIEVQVHIIRTCLYSLNCSVNISVSPVRKQTSKSLENANLSGKFQTVFSDTAETSHRQFGGTFVPQSCLCPVLSESLEICWSSIFVMWRWRQLRWSGFNRHESVSTFLTFILELLLIQQQHSFFQN